MSPSSVPDPVELASELVRIDTVNPPGQEARAARLVAEHLAGAGIESTFVELAPGRESLVARLPGTDDAEPALCLSGHLDTVPLGNERWSHDPLGGELDGDRLWGRGSTDMKGACAAMVSAFVALASRPRRRPLVLALCASEETGSQGAALLPDHLGAVGALVIGEPTSGRVAVAHKGVAWLRLRAEGKAAHGSLPHLGENAIVKMAGAIGTLEHIDLSAHEHRYVGAPTVNVGTIAGGAAPNVVPDLCEALVDVRLIPRLDATTVQAAVQATVGEAARVTIDTDLPAVETAPEHAWMQRVIAATADVEGRATEPIGMRYFSDASVLAPALGNPPVAIVGPGDPALAHQVDEWCSIAGIRRAASLYERLGAEWGEIDGTVVI